MEKIIYLARKLKAFTFDEIYMLAEMSKEELNLILEKLVSENILKEDAQGYLFIKGLDNWRPKGSVRTKPFIEGADYEKFKQEKSKDKIKKTDKHRNYGLFVPNNELTEYQNQKNVILKVGDKIQTTILKFNPDDRRISLSIKNDD